MPSPRLIRLAAALLALAGARPAPAADVVVWHGYQAGERAALEAVAAAFNARQGAAAPRVALVKLPADGFVDRVTGAVPRGKGPDVFIGPQDRLGGWVDAGHVIEPVEPLADAALRERFLPSTLQAMTVHGALQGLPLNYKVIVLVHNRRLLPEPPRTTAELEAVARRLTDRAAGRYGLAYAYTDYYFHAALQNGLGGRAFDGARPTLDAPENVRALELLLRWRDQFLPEDSSAAEVTRLFNDGRAAMVFSGPWFLGEIAPGIDYALAPLPTLSEAHGQPMRPWMTVEGAFVTAPSRQKEAAFAFVRYLTDVEAARVMALRGRQTPAAQQVYQDPQVAADRMLSAFLRQALVAVPMPNIPEMTAMWSPATTALGAAVRGSATPQEALEKAQKQVERNVAAMHAR